MATTQGIRLNSEIQRRLKWLAEKKDRSMNYLISEAIGRYLDNEERFELEKQEDQKRLQHYLDTGEHISQEQMKARFKALASKAKRAAS